MGIECWIGGPEGTDVNSVGGGRVGLRLLLYWEVPLPPLGSSSSNVGGPLSSSRLSRRHRSREQSDVMDDVLDRFIGLQQIPQYDVSCQKDIGKNPSSSDSALTNHKENARFWLRKQI